MVFLASFVFLAALLSHASAQYDYVVVGGGLSGLVVSSRLAEDPNSSILVLEAGQNSADSALTYTPGFEINLANTAVDWNFTTTPQPYLQNRSIAYQQGFTLGGGSAVNYMAYARGAPSVFDEWAAAARDPSWAWNSIVKYFNKATTFTPPAAALQILTKTSLYSSADGPVHVSYPAWQENFGSYFIAGFHNKSGPNLPIIDYSAGTSIGTAYHTMTIDPRNSTRSSSATAYFRPASALPNYHVSTGSYVSKLILKNGVAQGVEYFQGGVKKTAYASREVILAAGAAQTPKLLMLSGIGPEQHLKSKGINVVQDLAGVGSNLQDHVFPVLTYEVTPNITTTAQWLNDTLFQEIQSNYTNLHTGELSSDLGGSMATERVPKNLLQQWKARYHQMLPSDRNNIQYLFDSTSFGPPTPTNVVAVVPVLVTPESRGTIRLASANYTDPPVIDPNYLSSPADRQILLWSVKRLRAVMASSTFDSIRLGEVTPGANVTSDNDLTDFIQKTAFTIHHICGSAAMGALNKGGVVDNELKVYGFKNLRIVDASVFPAIPTVQIQSAVYALAEKAADIIKGGAGQ